uniref:Uncharacterized protein n=1 Tax=Anguilla anguilla TaxID=7936 RepID=A0A0E9SUD2_ANGAN
MKNSLPFSIA